MDHEYSLLAVKYKFLQAVQVLVDFLFFCLCHEPKVISRAVTVFSKKARSGQPVTCKLQEMSRQ